MFEGYKWRCTIDYTGERFDRSAEDDCEYETCSVCEKKINLCDDDYYYDEETGQHYCEDCTPCEYETCAVCGKKLDLCDEDEYYYDEKTEQYYCMVCVPCE